MAVKAATTPTTRTNIPQGLDKKPTKPKAGVEYHQGKDGKWYTYQDLSVANRIFLQNRFEFDKIQEAIKQEQERQRQRQRQNKKNTNPKKRKSTTNSPQDTTRARRSRRLSQVSDDNPSGMSLEELEELERKLRESPAAKRLRTIGNTTTTTTPTPSGGGGKSRRGPRAVALTDEERAKFETLPDWIDGLAEYLTVVAPVSDQNLRSVMRQVKCMAAGLGITYHHWPEGVYFYKNVKIDLSFDFDSLYQEAVDYENEHGRDLGNGWLLRHPITKLHNYQDYLSEQQEKN